MKLNLIGKGRTMTTALTKEKRAQKVLNFLIEYVKKNGEVPFTYEIAQKLGMAEPTIGKYFQFLEVNGCIKREYNTSLSYRGIVILNDKIKLNKIGVDY